MFKKILNLLFIVIGGTVVYKVNQMALNEGLISPLPMTVFTVSALYILTEYFLKDFIFGKERSLISETNGEYIDKWGRRILHIIALCVFFFFILKSQDQFTVKITWLSIITITLGFQSVMEWKYLGDSKEYILTSILLPLSLLIVILF